MAIAITDRGTASNTTGATLVKAITISSAEVIITAISEVGSTDGTLADATNGSHTKITSTQTGTTATRIQIFDFLNSAALAAVNLTYTKGTSGNHTAMAILSATGILTAAAVDASVTATANGPNADPPTLTVNSGTPGQAGELFVACAGGQMAGSGLVYSQDTTHNWATPFGTGIFSAQSNSGTQIAGGSQVNAGSSAITFNPTWSSGGVNRTRSGIVVGFKPSDTDTLFAQAVM